MKTTSALLLELMKDPAYDFINTNKYLEKTILLSLGGSKAYGTNNEYSDTDVRGIALNPINEIYGLQKDFEQVIDTNTDTIIYSLRKMMKLLSECNPNTIEILGCRPEDYLLIDDRGQMILDNKEIFLSQRATQTFGGYATQQFNRLQHSLIAKGEDSKPTEKHSMERALEHFSLRCNSDTFNASLDIQDNEIIINGTMSEMPVSRFREILSELHNVNSAFGNVNHRNQKRTEGKLAKHMMHLIRLYMTGLDIIKRKEINVYRAGAEHDLLMDIRNGKYYNAEKNLVLPEFNEILKDYQDQWLEACKCTKLPETPNYEAINNLMEKIIKY